MPHLAHACARDIRFRPCSGKCEGACEPERFAACRPKAGMLPLQGETRLGSGARSLWWLAASIAALTWYTEVGLKLDIAHGRFFEMESRIL